MKYSEWMKHIVVCLLLSVLPLTVSAEHLFEVGLRTGLSGFDAQCRYVSPVPDLHAGLQLSYSYQSSHIIGFRVAATIDRNKAGFGKTGYADTYSVIDVENESMQVDYSIGRLREMHTTWSVGIPLQLALAKNRFSFFLGPKMVFPFQSTWTETAQNAALSVYYPKYNNRIYNSYPLAASPSFRETQRGTQVLPKIQYWIAAELSYDVLVHTGRRTKSYLSLGVYFDYCASSVSADPSDRISLLMLSDTRDGFPLQRIMTPVVSAFRQGRRLVTSRNPFDVGIKISYRFAPYNPRRQAFKVCHCND
ncbi:MAG: hypothetical protein II825_07830 [Paludibacteraceae bacterium]|nr:hypothetical protein [Paludibacteraceae bacterium]